MTQNRKDFARVMRSGRVVFKVGSGVLANEQRDLNRLVLRRIANEVATTANSKRWPLVVSSGAIALGMRVLGLKSRPRAMACLQAAAAAGQSQLVEAWAQAFRKHHLAVAQVLLTHADLADRERFLNARRALGELLHRKVTPIINENDSVSYREIAFGDNDELAAQVCNLVDADVLVMLSTAPGILDQDNNIVSMAHAEDRKLDDLAQPGASQLGRGGMISKLRAARVACRRGAYVAIIDGRQPGQIDGLLSGEDVGTLLCPDASDGVLSSRAHWIAHTLRPRGTLILDEGAVSAVRDGGKSLLPSGIRGVEGKFDQGDPVNLASTDSPEAPFARGLARYSADQIRQIMGQSSRNIANVLGISLGNEAIHRDDLVLL
jgi:glutamate 5-kinase